MSRMSHVKDCIELPGGSAVWYTLAGGVALCGLLLACFVLDCLFLQGTMRPCQG